MELLVIQCVNNMKTQLPVAIIIAALIIGGSFYAIQVNKQRSIEKQQQIEIQEKRRIDEAKAEQDSVKSELEEKEFDAERKNDCLKIYESENDKWNNVQGWRYEELEDQCYVVYKSEKKSSDVQCDELYPKDNSYFALDNALCKAGNFQRRF